MQRFGQVVGIKPEHLEEYTRLHAAVWPEVLEKIAECNIRNYSIFHHEGLLFAYFEYHGDDFEADMAAMARRRGHAALVGRVHADAGAARIARGRGVVEDDRGGLPHGLGLV